MRFGREPADKTCLAGSLDAMDASFARIARTAHPWAAVSKLALHVGYSYNHAHTKMHAAWLRKGCPTCARCCGVLKLLNPEAPHHAAARAVACCMHVSPCMHATIWLCRTLADMTGPQKLDHHLCLVPKCSGRTSTMAGRGCLRENIMFNPPEKRHAGTGTCARGQAGRHAHTQEHGQRQTKLLWCTCTAAWRQDG